MAPEAMDYHVMVTSGGWAVVFNYRLHVLALPWKAYLPLMTSQK
jgi:hypothetical protein